jgi:alanine racemase
MIGLSADERVRRGHPLWAEVDLGAIRHNVAVLANLAAGAEFMGVVKSYAYGHGNPAAAIAMLQGGAARLGVARLAEGLHLREAGIEAPIHLFTEPPPESIPALLEHDIVPAVYTGAFATALDSAATTRGARVPVHLKLDTGMHRVGLPPDDLEDAVRLLRGLRGLEVEGVWSHLATADVPGHSFTHKQLELFEDLVSEIARLGLRPRVKHIANSAATMSLPASHLDLVRCGVACYGLWPGPDFAGSADLRPAFALKARVNMVKMVPAGGALSYGLAYGLESNSRVVTIPAGYGDGYDRGFSGTAEVLLGGHRYRVSGTVCMDQFMVDLGDATAHVGDVATLIGEDSGDLITAEELADHIGTINYEVTTRIASRVPRIYLNEIEPDRGP